MIGPQSGMPDDGWGRKVIEDLQDSVESLRQGVRDVRKLMLGNGTRGVFTRLELIQERLDRLEGAVARIDNSVDVLERPGEAVDERTKWQVIGRIAEVVGIVSAVAMSFANTMGWL